MPPDTQLGNNRAPATSRGYAVMVTESSCGILPDGTAPWVSFSTINFSVWFISVLLWFAWGGDREKRPLSHILKLLRLKNFLMGRSQSARCQLEQGHWYQVQQDAGLCRRRRRAASVLV